MAEPKICQRGETIYKEDDPIERIYLVQAGIITICVQRGGQQIELSQVQSGQFLGEEALWGATRWEATARANNEVTLLPIELKMAIQLWRSALPLGRALGQSLIEKHKRNCHALRELRMEEDPTPCPEHRITKLFAVLYHSAMYTGTHKPGKTTVVWPAFKKYCQRTFLESPVRLEQATNILVKLGYAELEFVPCETDPEAPDELGFVHFKNLEVVRTFVDFHRKLEAEREKTPPTEQAHQDILTCIEDWNSKGKVSLHDDEEEPNAAA